MRYVLAMIAAICGAAAMMFLASGGVADFIVARYRFANSTDAGTLHMAAFMAANAAGLIAGWTVGWVMGALATRG